MKDFYKNVSDQAAVILLLVVLTASVVLARRYGQLKAQLNERPDTVVVSDTLWVSLPSPVVEKLVPIEVQRIDTVFIVKDYQMMRIYADTINTQYGQICIIDTIHQNALTAQRVEYDLKFVPPDRTRSNTIAIGGGMSPMSAIATIQYRHKRWGYEGGYDFLQKAPMVKISYDIFRW